jgi:hypothetical protein
MIYRGGFRFSGDVANALWYKVGQKTYTTDSIND